MFKKPKRVPRKIDRDDDGEGDDSSTGPVIVNTPVAVVKRPGNTSKQHKTNPIRKAPISAESVQDEAETATVVKKPALGARLKHLSSDRLPNREGLAAGGPSYTADYLAELKSSTPNAPATVEDEAGGVALDDQDENGQGDSQLHGAPHIASNFGNVVSAAAAASHEHSTALIDPNAINSSIPLNYIPTASEIQEKKERRQRLKHEQDFISLEDAKADDPMLHGSDSNMASDDDDNPRQRSLIQHAELIDAPAKYPEGRLERDDEDFAEGFDSFVDDPGRVALASRAAKEQNQQRRRDIDAQIRRAQRGDVSSDDEDKDEDAMDGIDRDDAAGIRAYEAAQTRAGTYATKSSKRREREREEKMHRMLTREPKLRPIPTLSDIIAKVNGIVEERTIIVHQTQEKLENLRRQRQVIAEDEVRVMEGLRDAAAKFEKESGLSARDVVDLPPDFINTLGSGGAAQGSEDSDKDNLEGFEGNEENNESEDRVPEETLAQQMMPNGQALAGGISGMAAAPRDEYEDD